MRRRASLAFLAGLAACGTLAGSAGGAAVPSALFVVFQSDYTPGLSSAAAFIVIPTASTTLAAASVAVYVPSGYTLDLGLPVGTQIGALVTTESADSGDLTVADPTAFENDPCAPGPHAAVWTAKLPISGQQVIVPLFVDPTTADEAARGAYRITYCQSQLVVVDLEKVLTSPAAPGIYVWRGFVTPAFPSTAPPDPNSVYELRALVPLPNSLRIKAAHVTSSKKLVLTGKATAGTGPEANATVGVDQVSGSRVATFAIATTRADGTFTIRKTVGETKAARTLHLTAGAIVPPAPCADPPLAPAGCLEQTVSPSSETTFGARIPKLPARPPKR